MREARIQSSAVAAGVAIVAMSVAAAWLNYAVLTNNSRYIDGHAPIGRVAPVTLTEPSASP